MVRWQVLLLPDSPLEWIAGNEIVLCVSIIDTMDSRAYDVI